MEKGKIRNNKILLFFVILIFISCKNKSQTSIDDEKNENKTINNITVISSDSLLELVQKQTFKYFWDFAEPETGLVRERSQDMFTLTSGGTGMGISSFPAAVNRNWITKNQAIQHLTKILLFLENADTYHGAFSHWYFKNGKTKEFSEYDDGGDIVETALLMQGLLINRAYFSGNDKEEKNIRKRITALWRPDIFSIAIDISPSDARACAASTERASKLPSPVSADFVIAFKHASTLSLSRFARNF